MSPVCFVSVIDFLMSLAQDIAHDGAGLIGFFFQIPGLISV